MHPSQLPEVERISGKWKSMVRGPQTSLAMLGISPMFMKMK
jgi:hypothetical protein